MEWYSLCVAMTGLKMYPVFEIAHYCLMSMNMRADMNKNVPFNYAKQHPLASWISTMMLCFAGATISCLMYGRPWATILTSPEKVILASIVWYLMNYTPSESFFKICSSRLGRTLITILKEVHRCYGIYGGILEASKSYPGHILVYFVAAFLKGSAAEIFMFFSRMVAGVMKPAGNQFMTPNAFLWPSSVFKSSAVISLLFVLEVFGFITVDHAVLFTAVIIVLIYFRLCMIWGLMGDPFIPIENLVCSILFGGMWDAYKRATENGSHANGDMKVKRS